MGDSYRGKLCTPHLINYYLLEGCGLMFNVCSVSVCLVAIEQRKCVVS